MKTLIKFLDKYNITYSIQDNIIVSDDINLYNNKLTELPESIGNLKCNYLDLSNNKLTELPESFGNIKCNNINLSKNKLTELPESIGNIKCNNLDLSYNKLTELPESFGNLKCNFINLYKNKLTSLPESIGNLKCNILDLSYNELTSLPEHKNFDEFEIGIDYIYCDGILTHYESIKYVGEYKVYVGYNDNFVVTKDDKVFAHGMSIRQGISDLLFKLSDRNKSDYENLTLDDILPLEEAIVMYRVLTGACSYGVEQFMKDKEFNKTISIREIDKVIGDSYGSKQFREFFKIKDK